MTTTSIERRETIESDLDRFHERAFGRVAETVRDGSLDRNRAIEIMRAATLEAVPDCRYAFGHGSALQGGYGPYSDLDVVVLVDTGKYWEKRCLNRDGVLVELQIYALDILDALILLAQHSGMSFGLMAGNGEILVDRDGGAAPLRDRLRTAFEGGPRGPSKKAMTGFRHKLTNRIVELLGVSDPGERTACGLSLFDLLMRVELTLSTGWRHSGKWLPRVLDAARPDTFREIEEAYRRLADGDPLPLANCANRLLDRIGGPLWTGYVQHQSLDLDMVPAAALIAAAQQIRD